MVIVLPWGLTRRDVKHRFPLNQLMIVKFVLLSPSRAKNSLCLHQAITINSSFSFVKKLWNSCVQGQGTRGVSTIYLHHRLTHS